MTTLKNAHLVLEYSFNISPPSDSGELFGMLHRILNEVGGISIQNCKSRARIADPYYVAAGGGTDAFVHLDIRFLEGRSSQVRAEIGRNCLELLREWYTEEAQTLELQITVEVREIAKAGYFKYPGGTLDYR